MTESSINPADDGPTLEDGAVGVIKGLHQTFGFIRTASGTDLFFLPTGVDAEVCRFKQLKEQDRVTFQVFQHRRGLRARCIQKQH